MFADVGLTMAHPILHGHGHGDVPSTFLGRLSSIERARLLNSLSPGVGAAVIEHLKHLTMTPARQSEATSKCDRLDGTCDASDASDAPNAPPPSALPCHPTCSTDPVDPVAELYRQMAAAAPVPPTPSVQASHVPPAPLAMLAPLVSSELPLSRPTPRRLAPARPPTDRHPRPAGDAGSPEASSGPPVQACTPREESAALMQAAAFGPPHAKLLSRGQMQLLLPAMLPEARRWLERQARDGEAQGAQQRQLQELARYCAHLQQRELKRDKERLALRSQVARQQDALLRGAKHMQAQRIECASHQQAAEKAAARRRLLERSLRAALRPSGLAAANISPPHR